MNNREQTALPLEEIERRLALIREANKIASREADKDDPADMIRTDFGMRSRAVMERAAVHVSIDPDLISILKSDAL